MVATGLLVLTTPLRALSATIFSVLQLANNHVKKTLYVHILPGKSDVSSFNIPLATPSDKLACTNLISLIYASANNTCSDLDVRIFLDHLKQNTTNSKRATKNQFDVILTNCTVQIDMKSFVQNRFYQNTDNIPIVHLPCGDVNTQHCPTQELNNSENEWKDFNNIVLGGTFDRLHPGHKILLSEALMRCQQQLTVGVTDETMIKKKLLNELIQPTSVRIEDVEKFLDDVDPSVKYIVTPISDPFGPSTVDPQLQCIIVSEETLKGGHLVNERRIKKQMNPLHIHTINLIPDLCHSPQEESKISSSSERIRLLGRRIKNPELRTDIPKYPYIVGLTGGISSGKSSIANRLEKLGMTVIHADQVAHSSYLPGTDVYSQIVSEFGNSVVGADGVINRKRLGEMVFSNPLLLNRLNKIVWPAVEKIIQVEISRYAQLEKKFILVEIPVLIESGMTRLVHEVWVSIIPREVAIQRIQKRDGLTAEQAGQRIDSQISNEARVSHAHVVFCTLWEPEFTQKQVEKAWRELNEYLSNISAKY